MPKFAGRHKQHGRATVTKSVAPRAIGELLARRTPALSPLGDQAARQALWQSWLTEHLPEELAAHLTGAVERDGALTVFADSSAWAARLRYQLRDLERSVRARGPAVTRISVRVLPEKSGRQP